MPSTLWWKGLLRPVAAAVIVMGCTVGGAVALTDGGGSGGSGGDSGDGGSSGGGGGNSSGSSGSGGDGDGSRSSSGTVAPARVSPDGRTVCREGWFYSLDLKICQWSGNVTLNDTEIYQQGRDLALDGHFAPALQLLVEADQTDPMVLTMIGYATRKLGYLDEGIAIYHQALAIDPDNLNTHEYLGEGYLDAGRIDLAEAELDTLGRLCGTDCRQYRALAGVIAGDGVWR